MTSGNKDNKLYVHFPAGTPSKMPGDYFAEVATQKFQTMLYNHLRVVTVGLARPWQMQSRSRNPDQMTLSDCIFQNRPKAYTVDIETSH